MTTLPVEVEELTPAFFGRVFGAEVERVTLRDRHSGTTGRVLVELGGAPGLPATVFVKLARSMSASVRSSRPSAWA